MLSISVFELCDNENGSYDENIQCCILITINNEIMLLQIVDEDSFIRIYIMYLLLGVDILNKDRFQTLSTDQ